MFSARTVHTDSSYDWQNQSDNTEVQIRIIYFFISYIILTLFNYLFLTATIRAHLEKYHIYPLPSKPFLLFIQLFIILLLGFLGLYSTVQDLWTPRAWLYYFLANLIIALITFLYQTGKGFTIFAVSLCSIVLAIIFQLLFIQTSDMQKGFQKTMIRNLIGVVLSWGIIWSMMSLGQWFVHDLGMNIDRQAILFFISTFGVLVGCVFWNHNEEEGKWNIHYGYCYFSTASLLLSAFTAYQSINSDY